VKQTNRGHWWTKTKKLALQQWMLTFVVGVLQGVTAWCCNLLSRSMSDWKYGKVYETLENSSPLAAYFLFLLFQVGFVLVACLMVFVEPIAAGSGIPEVKCYLNGIALPNLLKLRTFVCKVVGVAFSVAGGLPVGKEGPMVHSGAAIASLVSQGTPSIAGINTKFSMVSELRKNSERRDFVACGAAAGVASAFGAPIGGVLFSLEEGATFWSAKVTWRAFFGAMITIFTLYFIKNASISFGQADTNDVFSFGEVS